MEKSTEGLSHTVKIIFVNYALIIAGYTNTLTEKIICKVTFHAETQ